MGTFEVTCPACESPSYDSFVTRNGMPIVKCKGCGTLYARLRPGPGALRALYEQFPQLSNGREGQVQDDPRDGRWEAVQRLRRILPYASSGRLLDLGCGRGDFLIAARTRFDSVGVDVFPRLRPEARSIPVFKGDLEEAKFADNSFDVVTAVEVLEHLFSPKATLREIRRILKPHSLLLIQTGDADSVRSHVNPRTWTYLQPPVHVNVFSRQGLDRVATDLSFSRLGAWSFGRAPLKIPFLSGLWKLEAARPFLDLVAKAGLIGQMQLWIKQS